MRILFITPSYKPAYIYGGTIVVTALLAERLTARGHQVTVYTTRANGDSELDVEPSAETLVNRVIVKYFNRATGDHTHASPALWVQLNRTVKNFDVVHIHSWWNLLVVGAAWICKRNRIKPIVSPHGMFSDYILTTRNAKKKFLLRKLLGTRLLKNTYLHVSTEMEENEAKRLVPEWHSTIIPNLVQLPSASYPRPRNEVFAIGFLSRIDPKKGLDILIKALSRVNFPYKLLIAGSGEEGYIRSLVELSKDCGNSQNIEWVGWKNGEEKFAFLSQVDLFALTSHSENFAIVVIESLSVGTPVLISDQVGLFKYVLQNACGWVCAAGVNQVKAKLEDIFGNKSKLKNVNSDGPPLINKDYDYDHLTNQYISLYTAVSQKKGH